MVLPIFLGMSPEGEGPACHTAAAGWADGPLLGLTATAVHGIGYLVVTAAIACLVFEKLGLGLLRKAWFNLDLLWAIALIATGALTFLL